MPWPAKQWAAIAADTIRRYGKKKGEAKLHRYKEEAGGHAVVDPEQAKKAARKHHKKRHHR